MLKRIKNIKFNSIKYKVSLFYTAILGLILVVYTGILFFGQSYAFYRDMDNELAVKAQGIANGINMLLPVLEDDQRAFRSVVNMVIREESVSPKESKITEAQKKWFEIREGLDLHRDYIVLTTKDGELVANSKNAGEEFLPYLLKNTSGSGEKAVVYRNLRIGAQDLRMITIPYYYKNKRLYLIKVAASQVRIINALYSRALFALLTIVFILIFTSFLGGLITRRIMEPVMKVTDIAKNITYKDLSARVKVENIDEELKYLVDAFNEMISRLDGSFRYIDEFNSNVAHELKTPLTIISGESELALMQKRDSKEYRRVIETGQREARQMMNVVDDLFLLSKLEYQPEAFKFEKVDLSTFIKEIFEQAKKLALPKNIEMELMAPDKEIAINADWPHLRRLFVNLLNNAIKFTPEGGKIGITVKLDEKKAVVSVSDTGIGITPDKIDKIFLRFFRGDHAELISRSGSGLGLSIAQSIAKIHHAGIAVFSHPGKGSTFTVSLPLYDTRPTF